MSVFQYNSNLYIRPLKTLFYKYNVSYHLSFSRHTMCIWILAAIIQSTGATFNVTTLTYRRYITCFIDIKIRIANRTERSFFIQRTRFTNLHTLFKKFFISFKSFINMSFHNIYKTHIKKQLVCLYLTPMFVLNVSYNVSTF